MIENNAVYCVQCGSIKSRENAESIFKTGFYKTVIPLAHCKDCVCTNKKEMDINIHINNEECFEMSIGSFMQFI
jgi:hypothetical protein